MLGGKKEKNKNTNARIVYWSWSPSDSQSSLIRKTLKQLAVYIAQSSMHDCKRHWNRIRWVTSRSKQMGNYLLRMVVMKPGTSPAIATTKH